MTITEINDKVAKLGNAWENFKQVNDARLSEVERKGHSDPLYDEHLSRINNALDNYKGRVNALEVANSRPEFAVEQKSIAYDSEYKQAFRKYLRKGMDAGLEAIQTKALSVGTDADGGYLVTPELSELIVRIINETSPMRSLARVETISTDSLELIEDTNQVGAAWTTEAGVVSDTATQQIGKHIITVHEMYAQPKATQKLVDDSAIDIEAWIAEKVAEKFATTEATAFISGSGIGQPKGILSYAAGTLFGQVEQVVSGTSAVVTSDGLVNLYYSLKEAYTRNASFLMNRSVVQAIRLLKETTTDQYLWQPGLSAGTPDSLLGLPVYQAADMPVAAADSLSIALGDFRAAYLIVDRIGLRILRDPFTDKPFVKFYTTKRVGGEVINSEAIKLQKLAI